VSSRRLVGPSGGIARFPAGKTYHQVIGEAIDSAKCIIVVWSVESVKSGWVLEEAEAGKNRGILVPVIREHVSPPFGFRTIQAADLSRWDANELQRLVRDIGRVIGVPARSERGEPAAPIRNVDPPPTVRPEPLRETASLKPGEPGIRSRNIDSSTVPESVGPGQRLSKPVRPRSNAIAYAAQALAIAVAAVILRGQLGYSAPPFALLVVVSALSLCALRYFAPSSAWVKVATFIGAQVILDTVLLGVLR